MSVSELEIEAQAHGQSTGDTTPEAPVVSQFTTEFAEAVALTSGYTVDVSISDTLGTSMTSVGFKDQRIKVGISRALLERAEASDALDFFGFNVVHEVGHVKRFIARPPKKALSKKDNYFTNVVEDVAINYDNARQTRYISDVTKKAYDSYLFPMDQRAGIATQPRHQQFMDSLLVLAMTTPLHTSVQEASAVEASLEAAQLQGLDPLVIDRLNSAMSFEVGGASFNLLQQLKEYGTDLPYYDKIVKRLKAMYDELYEQDVADKQQQQPGESGEPSEPSDSNGDTDFDYSESGGCQHGEPSTDETKVAGSEDKESTKTPSDTDLSEIAKELGDKIAEAMKEAKQKAVDSQAVPQLTAEQLKRLQTELGLSDPDFQGFMSTVSRYGSEIHSVTDLILQLRRERQNEFLAPSHDISSRGHKIHVGKLLGYLANGSNDPTPDIWKTPSMKEHSEYEFDGADFYFLCDISGSMEGEKAQEAAASAVVLSQGVQDASVETYGDVPPIRIQIQAFGAGDDVLCKLTDAPSNRDLGTMYSSLSNPSDGSTQVSGALSKIRPEKGRLSVVVVLSDGQFHDESEAARNGKKLEDDGAVLIQCVFGGATVSTLSVNAHRMNLRGASDLPNYLFGLMPELIDTLRRSTHA